MSRTIERPRPAHLVRHALRRPAARFKLVVLVASGASFVLSVSLWFSDHQQQGIFVGIWVPSILSLGALLLAGTSDGGR